MGVIAYTILNYAGTGIDKDVRANNKDNKNVIISIEDELRKNGITDIENMELPYKVKSLGILITGLKF